MTERAEIAAFMTRWGMSLPEKRTYDEFRTRVSNVVAAFRDEWGLGDAVALISIEEAFASVNGSTYQPDSSRRPENLRTFVSTAETFADLVLILQRILWAVDDYVRTRRLNAPQAHAFKALVLGLNQAIEYSSGINLRKLEVGEGAVTLYPDGVALLDRELIDSTVAWLEDFPGVAREFKSALHAIALRQPGTLRQALDSLRFALEMLLKVVLGNNAPLEKQKDTLLAWMKNQGVHPQIRNSYVTLLGQFALFQNDLIKHDNAPGVGRACSLYEAEYMVYLTGAFMRLILEARRAA